MSGIIYNHSEKPLYVVETDTGPARVHILGPRTKSPSDVDTDGFKRVDGKTTLGHKHWWKIIPLVSVEEDAWGIKMAYVTGIRRNEKNQVTHYGTDTYGLISREQGIELASEGKLDNVVIVKTSSTTYLRAKPNTTIGDNIG